MIRPDYALSHLSTRRDGYSSSTLVFVADVQAVLAYVQFLEQQNAKLTTELDKCQNDPRYEPALHINPNAQIEERP